MDFKRQDMDGVHYKWEQSPEKAEAMFSGEPSRRLFDRVNGDQVLFIINFYGSVSKDFTIHDARALEWKITHLLPAEIRSEKSVFNWIGEV